MELPQTAMIDWRQSEILERFDQAWQRERRPNLANYVPADHADRRALIIELVIIDLEYRLNAGDEAPLVETYLQQYPAEFSDSSEMIHLIEAEYQGRWRREAGVHQDEYLRRFPQHADLLAGCLKPRWECPFCQKTNELADEMATEAVCSGCMQSSPVRRGRDGPLAPSAPRSVKEGETPNIPGYEVLAKLGSGGMGVVYKARQLSPPRVVALKMIRTGAQARIEERVHFQIEAEAIASMQHPNIVQIYEYGVHDGVPFFSLEFVEGGSLQDRLAGGLPSPDEAARLIRQLALAMHYAHLRGVVHRDLKPGNILLGCDGTAKITDFGLAKRLDAARDPTHTGAIMGTASYMSPEQARDSKHVGPPTDIYGLGAIFYEMLTGRPPFKGKSLLDILDQLRKNEPISPSKLQPARRIPHDLETICLKCLKKERAQRYATAQELADDLDRYFRHEPIQARRVPGWERTLKWVRRHPLAATLIGFGTVMFLLVLGGVLHSRHREEVNSVAYTEVLVHSLASANTAEVPTIVDELSAYRRWADPMLRKQLAESSPDSKVYLHIVMALGPTSDFYVDYLYQRLLSAKPGEVLIIRLALQQHKDAVKDRLWAVLEDKNARLDQRVRAACGLAAYDPANPLWPDVCQEIALGLMRDNALALGEGTEALRPIKSHLLQPLQEIYLDGKQTALGRETAFRLLADYAKDQPVVLAELDKEADDQDHIQLLPLLRSHRGAIIALMRQELEREVGRLTEERFDQLAKRRARAAIALLQLDEAEPVWPLLRHTSTPNLRTYLTHDLGNRGTEPFVILRRLEMETNTSARRALILSLGEIPGKGLVPAERQRLLALLVGWHRDDPDAGIHSAAEWLLRCRLEHEPKLNSLKAQPGTPRSDGAGWYVSPIDHTMAVIAGPVEFRIGSLEGEKDRYATEDWQQVRIPRSFALATKETTVEQFLRFLKDTGRDAKQLKLTARYSPSRTGPIIAVTWYEAAQYCRWLSDQESLPPEEMCYPPLDEIKPGMKLPSNYLSRTGYRLPTEAEWEYACRAGAETSRYYGSSDELLPFYANFIRNSQDRTWPVGSLKPNDFGLFDMQGNANEWCQTLWLDRYPGPSPEDIWEDVEDTTSTDPCDQRVLRGGSFLSPRAGDVRSALRGRNQSTLYFDTVGFRVARTWRP